VIFAKYLKTVVGGAPVRKAKVGESDEERFRLRDWVFFVPEEINPGAVYARAALLALLAVYGVHLAMLDVPSGEIYGSLMHPPLIPIHEFGHIVFSPFGEFMHTT